VSDRGDPILGMLTIVAVGAALFLIGLQVLAWF
jgi:hypothetical protein